MIPLNKPFNGFFKPEAICSKNGFSAFQEKYFSDYHLYWTYSARNGLDIIYSHLYKSFGALKVGVSPLTCFEALYPIVLNHHKIIFIDIDSDSFNMDEMLLLDSDEKFDVIQPIHLGGNPQKMDIISKWAKERNVFIVEDCAQSIGSYFNNQHVGSFGDFSVFSLVKNLHTTYGAILFSKHNFDIHTQEKVPLSLHWYKSVKRYLESKCSHEKSNLNNFFYRQILQVKDSGKSYFTPKNYFLPKKFISNQERTFGYHNSLNEIRFKITEKIIDAINPNHFSIQKTPDGGLSNRNRLLIKSKTRPAKEIINYLRKQGIAANNLTQNYLNGFQESILENSSFLNCTIFRNLQIHNLVQPCIVSIPNSPALNSREVDYIAEKVKDIL